jgi:hypothetical protein
MAFTCINIELTILQNQIEDLMGILRFTSFSSSRCRQSSNGDEGFGASIFAANPRSLTVSRGQTTGGAMQD